MGYCKGCAVRDDHVDALRARVEVLEGALEFYAEVKNHCKPWGHIHSAMDADAGEKARAALAGGGKEGE